MGVVTSLTITDSGNYYQYNPSVHLSFPNIDSDYAGIDSQDFKFGYSSLVHDSSNTSTIATLTDSYGGINQQIAEIAFWIKPTFIEASTILWSDDFRIVMDSYGYAGMVFNVDSTIYQDAHAVGVTQTVFNTSLPLDSGAWNFIHFELLKNTFRANVNTQIGPSTNVNIELNPPYDSGDIFRVGKDLANISPIATKPGIQIPSKSFTGQFDHFTFTKKSAQPIFDNIWSTRVPVDSDDYYYNQVPEIKVGFDYKRATARATIDSSIGEVNGLFVIDGGFGYDSAPIVTISSGRSLNFDSSYEIGDSVTQTLSSGVIMRGEVQRYQLDSSNDLNRYLYLAHVGSDDGKFTTFTASNPTVLSSRLSKTNPSYSIGLEVISATEINTLSEGEQNELFTEQFVDDFLDFSEDNPFGDPENQ